MSFRKSESGNILVFTAICMTVLVGFAGMALDVGLAYRTRQKVQTAADAGAVAAALSYYNAGSGTSAADTAVQKNGYPGTSTDVTVTHPVSFNGTSGFTQVTVSEPHATTFMRLFGFNLLTVAATAVAGPALAGTGCVFLTGTSGTDLTFSKSDRIQADCGINANSNIDVADCGGIGKTDATYIKTTGSVTGHKNCPKAPAITANAPAAQNPWQTNDLTGPALNTGCTSTFAGAITISSTNLATYSGSSSNNVVCFTGAVKLGNGGTITLPGSASGVVYVFEGGVTIGGGTVNLGTGSCTGSGTSTACTTTAGAMMEIACPPTGSCSSSTFNTPASGSTLNIYAPTSGTATDNPYLNGIAIFQPYTDTNQLNLQFGSSNIFLDGYIYVPGAAIDLHDQGGGIGAGGIVAGSVTSDSNGEITISYDQANSGTTLNRTVTLVE